MFLRTLTFVAAIGMAGVARAEEGLVDNEAMLRSLKPVELTRFAPTGERTRVLLTYSLNPSCTSAGKIVVKILKKPQHGELTVRNEDGFSNFAEGNARAKCNSVAAPTTSVYYTSEPDFIGEDSAQVMVFFLGSGTANLDNVSIFVR